MSTATTKLDGFEISLAKKIAADMQVQPSVFRWADADRSNVRLVFGRTIFVQDMLEEDQIESIAERFEAEPGEEAIPTDYDPHKEPTVAIYTESNQGLRPSASRGGVHEWVLRFILRAQGAPETSKALLEELTAYVIKIRGVVGRHVIKGRELTQRPKAFARAADDHAYSDAVIRFVVVALPN